MKKLGAVGDVNPIEYGGGFVFGAPGQDPWIEYTYGLESEAPKGVRLNDTRVDTWFERDRAHVALYWDELDQYPLTLTAKELEKRWGL
jgi:hypothetical protein